jgi:hypothetical protein
MATHHFGKGTFKKELWINGGALFTNPIGVDVESEISGAFSLVVVDEKGVVRAKNTHSNAHGGWTSWDLRSLGVNDGRYKLGFANAAPGERRIKQGDVRLKG